MRRLAFVGLAIVAAACVSQTAVPTDGATGLPIFEDLPAFRGSAAALAWRDSTEAPDGMGPENTVHRTIADLVAALHELASQQGGMEMTIGFLGAPAADRATLIVHAELTNDREVAGDELITELRRNDRGWYVDTIRFRSHCRRAVDLEAAVCT